MKSQQSMSDAYQFYCLVLGLIFTTSMEWSILCFIDFFASLNAHLDFKHGKINKRKKECSILCL